MGRKGYDKNAVAAQRSKLLEAEGRKSLVRKHPHAWPERENAGDEMLACGRALDF